MLVAILSLGISLIQAVALTWSPTSSSWPTPGNWLPPGPPTASDAADFLGSGTGAVDLNNGGSGLVADTILFNAATPNYYVENTFNNMPTFSELLTVGTSITKSGGNTVQLVNLRFNVPTLTVNSGGFELQGTNIATIGTANINGGIVCIMAWPPSSISAGIWNVNGGLFKVSGLGVTSPGTASSLIGTVNMAGGTFQAGCSVGTANIIGDLNYSAGAGSDFELGTPGIIGSAVNDLINVDGNLTLNGTFNVIPVPGFGAGTYRLINYNGALVNNGAVLGSVPSGYLAALDLSVTNQINLIVSLNSDCCPSNNAPIVCYTNTIYSGFNYLVNHLCPGASSPFVSYFVDGMVLAHWNVALQDFEVYAMYDTGFGGWVDGNFNPISIPSLAVGEEFVIFNPGQAYTNIICGKTPLCPPPCLTNTTAFELVGRLGIGFAYWTNLSSCPPTCGTEVRAFPQIM